MTPAEHNLLCWTFAIVLANWILEIIGGIGMAIKEWQFKRDWEKE